MRIGGKLPHSFIDYPGQISIVVFTQGCNLNCVYCHNRQLLDVTTPPIPEEEILAFLQKRADCIDHLVITGGEPTIQPDLAQFCSKAKALGYKIKLDTNGIHPLELKFLIERQLVDYVAMDLKTDPGMYTSELLRGPHAGVALKASMLVLKESGLPHEYRTTMVRELVSPQVLQKLATILEFIYAGEYHQVVWYLQQATPVNLRFQPYTEEELISLFREANLPAIAQIR